MTRDRPRVSASPGPSALSCELRSPARWRAAPEERARGAAREGRRARRRSSAAERRYSAGRLPGHRWRCEEALFRRAPLLCPPVASSAAEAPAVFETESCSRASDVRGAWSHRPRCEETAARHSQLPRFRCERRRRRGRVGHGRVGDWHACMYHTSRVSNPVWVQPRGWCGSQGGRRAHVLKTPTSGREDGIVRCVQGTA